MRLRVRATAFTPGPAVLTVAICLAVPLFAQQNTLLSIVAKPSPHELARGRRYFEAQCARCHGIGGTGGFGPNLARARLRRAPDDATLLSVIRDGIPRTPMGLEFELSDREIAEVGAYVRSLGRLPVEKIAGNPGRGRIVYADRGACATCHVLNGEGRSLGPDLTDVGSRRGPGYLRKSLVDPAADLPEYEVPYEPGSYSAYLPVDATTRDGRQISGYRVNEDAFSIQIRDAGGVLHSLEKNDLARLDKRQGTSLMPSYRDALSESELDDLVAYLASLRQP
jgi:putative heme-binding domain-containing protein